MNYTELDDVESAIPLWSTQMAVAHIDKILASLQGRSVVPTSEVKDALLDLRAHLPSRITDEQVEAIRVAMGVMEPNEELDRQPKGRYRPIPPPQ